MKAFPFILPLALALLPGTSSGTVDDARSFALEAASPAVEAGFTIREESWGGDLAVKEAKTIVHQLFKGNAYWFWLATDVPGATVSVHVYDSAGKLAESSGAVKAPTVAGAAAAYVVARTTGSYYLVVEIEKSSRAQNAWSLNYGFR